MHTVKIRGDVVRVEQGNELQKKFNDIKKKCWVFIILTGIILFVSVFVSSLFEIDVKTLTRKLQRSDYTNKNKSMQETRIQQLEEQIKQLQENQNTKEKPP